MNIVAFGARGLAVCLVLLALRPIPGWAQTGSTESDSLRSYELAEIVVGADEAEVVTPVTIQKVRLAALVREDAATVAEVIRLIPAAHVQTNSRGETLVYLRNAGERQVALFFDGALMNIPWDNRLDLSLVPVGVIGGMTVSKGVPSVLYGTNVIGGAVNMTSRSLGRPGHFTEATAMFGSEGYRQGLVTHLREHGRFSYAGALGYTDQEGLPLPDEADLPFNQPDADRRTNTDRQLFTAFSRGSLRFDQGAEVGLSVLHIDGEKGVAPESHVDPTVDRVRFWRYPLWRNTMVILNGVTPLGGGTTFRGAVWGGRFEQAIDQYADVTYQRRTDRQEDEDLTLGSRLILRQALGPGSLALALNALTSTHRQRDTTFEEEGPVVSPRLRYRQHLFSLGAEYDVRFGPGLDLLAGASLEGSVTPETGDKPPRDPMIDFGVNTGLVYQWSEGLALRVAAGRRVRFPTMRELFGEALRRFLVNPDLKPESSLLVETGVVVHQPAFAGEAIVFLNRTFDTIDQRRTPDGLRQRINLEGSRVYGVELTGTARPWAGGAIDGHVTWSRTRGFLEEGPDRPLVEKPEWLGTLSVAHNAPWGGSLLVQTVYTGRAYALDARNALVPLPTSLVLNARLAYRVFFPERGLFIEFFGRVDNLTDEVTLPQLGLPGAGRTYRFGASLAL